MEKNPVIYLDYNATTPVADEVLETMLPYFSTNFGNASSAHHLYGWQAKNAIETAKEQIATLIDCLPSEIYFTSGASESIQWALCGSNYNRLYTSILEHKASEIVVKNYLQNKEIIYLPNDKNGEIDFSKLESNADSLTSIMLANNEIGNINPIASIKEKTNGLVQTDATQAVGKVKVSVQELNVDLMSFSAHKMYGPKGIGALFVKKGTKINSILPGSGQQNGYRGGTLNVPAIVGFGKAAEISLKNIAIYQQNKQLIDYLKNELIQLPGVFTNGSANHLPNTANISFTKVDGLTFLQNLNKIAVSNGSACNSAEELPSHVLLGLGLSAENALSSLRFSIGIETTKQAIEMAVKHVSDIYLSLIES